MKRYGFSGSGGVDFDEDVDGDYVRYSDHLKEIESLRSQLASCRDEALERAIQICLDSQSGHRSYGPDAARRNCAERIRAYKESVSKAENELKTKGAG